MPISPICFDCQISRFYAVLLLFANAGTSFHTVADYLLTIIADDGIKFTSKPYVNAVLALCTTLIFL